MIREFQREYRCFSNFWSRAEGSPVDVQVMYDGVIYPSSEHAFVAAKTLDKDIRIKVAAIYTPGQAKRYGKTIQLRPDWDHVKDQVMYEIVRDKFTRNPELRAKLLATGNMILQEGNIWHDTYWGVDLKTGKGLNKLGKILMLIRNELRTEVN